jgi:uncharacterized membrane protein
MTDYRYGLAAALAGFTFSAAALAGPPSYTITPLGVTAGATPVCGHSPDAGGINDADEVTGLYCHGESQRGFRWRRGKIKDLGVPAGFADDASINVQPFGINAKGNVVGVVFPRQLGTFRSAAFLWNGRAMTVIANDAFAFSINDRGEVAGILLKSGGVDDAFLYSHGKVRDLDALPGAISIDAFAINNQGHIAGAASFPGGDALILWTGVRWKNLGTPPGSTAAGPSSINAFDEIVGNTNGFPAFLWNGAFTTLPCLPSAEFCNPAAINDDGTIVGFAATANFSAAIWLEGAVHDLNALIDPRDPLNGQVNLFSGKGINNRGSIVVDGQYQSGPKRGQYDVFLATPVEEVASRR